MTFDRAFRCGSTNSASVYEKIPEIRQLLVKYYEDEDMSVIAAFMKQRCRKTICG